MRQDNATALADCEAATKWSPLLRTGFDRLIQFAADDMFQRFEENDLFLSIMLTVRSRGMGVKHFPPYCPIQVTFLPHFS